MVYILSVFFSSKCSLFHNSKVFGSCIIHILYTGCAKIKKITQAIVLQSRRHSCSTKNKCNHLADVVSNKGKIFQAYAIKTHETVEVLLLFR